MGAVDEFRFAKKMLEFRFAKEMLESRFAKKMLEFSFAKKCSDSGSRKQIFEFMLDHIRAHSIIIEDIQVFAYMQTSLNTFKQEHKKAEQGRAGQGMARQGRAGQSRAGQDAWQGAEGGRGHLSEETDRH